MNEQQLQDWLLKKKNQKTRLEPEHLFTQIIGGDIASLGSAITLVESEREEDQAKSFLLLKKCLPLSGNSIRIGITGVPGVGKSTFIESFGMYLAENLGKRVAVLAVDPSSERTGGSILGDKTRMQHLSAHPNVFIRPTPSRNSLGGVARRTRESILLCEAAGFEIILIETVGVGQSETIVHSMVDFFLLLMLAGAGDELQGIKRGIMEMADAIVITKADGNNLAAAKRARVEYQNALHLFPMNANTWTPQTLICSSLENTGIEEIESCIASFLTLTKSNGHFDENRLLQDRRWMLETIKDQIITQFFAQDGIDADISLYESLIRDKKITSFEAANQLLEKHKEHARDRN